ncbi:hypothetical protein niasHT_023251 [Heterodera trifolii]|uniref:Uncharacterized protein n=1 Tax=Heterodera trifolii TaxID=157864 RepID=A0ABD2JDD2_9BILA
MAPKFLFPNYGPTSNYLCSFAIPSANSSPFAMRRRRTSIRFVRPFWLLFATFAPSFSVFSPQLSPELRCKIIEQRPIELSNFAIRLFAIFRYLFSFLDL